jgi:hypothetical protein
MILVRPADSPNDESAGEDTAAGLPFHEGLGRRTAAVLILAPEDGVSGPKKTGGVVPLRARAQVPYFFKLGYFRTTAARTFFCSFGVPCCATRAKAFRAWDLSWIGYFFCFGRANEDDFIFERFMAPVSPRPVRWSSPAGRSSRDCR